MYTKLRNVAGVAQTEAKKSSDLFAKCQYLDELTGGRGVVFATGTPISNSMAELYTMMRYLQYGMLQDRGLTLFDEWASTFGEVTTSVELKPEGTGYRMRTRFSRFYNLPELMALWREAADIQTADMLNFTKNAPDEEAVRLLRYYEGLALHYDVRGYCVCTSEGKDSRVLGHLMRRAGVRHFYMHSVTGIDPPELVYFQRANFQAYRDLGYLTYDVMYQYSMWQLMRRKKIPPLRKVRYCCEHLKERPVPQQGRAILSLGVRKYESVGRRKKRDELEIASDKKRGDSIIMPFDNSEKRRIFETCYQDNQRRINPLAYWTDSDIWSYSKDVGLEQCGLYNEGFERLGCIGCPMARRVGREQEFRRWPKFKAQYLRTFGHMLEDRRTLGLPVLEFASTPEQWFEWWLNDKAADKADGNQLTLWGYAEDRTAQPARLLDDIAWELGVNISDLRLVPETKRQALDIMRHMRERERYPLHMWEEAVCYLTGAEVQFGDYGKIEAYFIGNTNYAADQF